MMNDHPLPLSSPRFASCPPSRRFFLYGLGALCAIGSLFVANAAQAVVIEFTTAEGYSDGDLFASSDWTATSGASATSFIVDADGAGSVAASNAANVGATYNTPTDFTVGGPFTVSVDFSFVQTTATMGANATFLNLSYLANPTIGGVPRLSGGIGRSTVEDGYRLAAFASNAATITGAELGIDSSEGDFTSDVIRLTLTFTRGATSSTWTGTETIFNVTTNTLVETVTINSVNVASETNHNDTSLYSNLNLPAITSAGLDGLTIYSYTNSVPEPGAPLLLGGVGALFLLVRRRRLR